MTLKDSFHNLSDYIEREEYKGYDPYDILTSYIPFKQLGKWPSAIATQIQKRNPINVRPLLGIKKGINPKAFGLFLQTYSLIYQKTKEEKYLEKADYFFNWLNTNYSKGYAGKCWGYNFPWSSPAKYMDAYIPSAVVTGFVSKGLFEYYKITENKQQVLELMESACLFLDKDLEKVENPYGISISYTPVKKDICYNASLLAAESFAKAYSLNGNLKYKELAIRAVNFVIETQHEDGRWNYSRALDSVKERVQIDFHQGYVLESIFEIKNALEIDNKSWETALKKGVQFYIENQFFPSGQSLWRLPKVFPTEIHNQSQGIITFYKLKKYHPDALQFAKVIADWTTANMQAKDGHFYYQKFKTHTHKISYMRWSNAWMFQALSHIINP